MNVQPIVPVCDDIFPVEPLLLH